MQCLTSHQQHLGAACRAPCKQQPQSRSVLSSGSSSGSSAMLHSSRRPAAAINQHQQVAESPMQHSLLQQQQPAAAGLPALQQRDVQQQQIASGGSSRRGVLLGVAAVAAAALANTAQPSAAAAAVTSSAALEEYMKLEDQNKLRDQRSLDNIRGKYNIKRTIDGRVQLRRKSGAWMSVRLDMEVPGAILLRDMKTEAIYALETDGLPQVDLSDDYVLFMMFADGQWENDMTPIEFEEDGGQTKQLTMTEKEFHEFVGLLKEPEDEPIRKKR